MSKLTEKRTFAKDNKKKAEFNFMLDLESLIFKTAFNTLLIRCGFVFVDDQIAGPIDLRKIIDILHFGHTGTTKMLSEPEIFWMPGMRKDIEQNIKDCTACLSTGTILNYKIPKNDNG